MVSSRCIATVKHELRTMGLHFVVVDLGEIEIMEDLMPGELVTLKTALLKSGLELMDDKKAIIIEKIKAAIDEIVQRSDELAKANYSDYISHKLEMDYTQLATIFSELKGITIQQYIVIHRIERVKELLLYGNLNLTQISYKMNYSSVAHLSTQFKKVTGLPASHFMHVKDKRQIPAGQISYSKV